MFNMIQDLANDLSGVWYVTALYPAQRWIWFAVFGAG